MSSVTPLPPPDASAEAIWAFTRTFDGYAYVGRREYSTPPVTDHPVGRLGLLANTARGEFLANGGLPVGHDDQRACLFFEWRRLHAKPVEARIMRYLHELVEAIRRGG